MKEIKPITYTELMKSLDSFREKGVKITKEQRNFIIACRENEKPITYEKMAELWSNLWGKTSLYFMRTKYLEIKNELKNSKPLNNI